MPAAYIASLKFLPETQEYVGGPFVMKRSGDQWVLRKGGIVIGSDQYRIDLADRNGLKLEPSLRSSEMFPWIGKKPD